MNLKGVLYLCVTRGLLLLSVSKLPMAFAGPDSGLCQYGSVSLLDDPESVLGNNAKDAKNRCRFTIAEIVNGSYAKNYVLYRTQCYEMWPMAEASARTAGRKGRLYSIDINVHFCCLKRPKDEEATSLLLLLATEKRMPVYQSSTLMNFSEACEGCNSLASNEKECNYSNHGFREELRETIFHSATENICDTLPNTLP